MRAARATRGRKLRGPTRNVGQGVRVSQGVRVNQGIQQTVRVNQGIQQTVRVNQGIQQTVRVNQGIQQGVRVSQGVQQGVSVNQGVKQGSDQGVHFKRQMKNKPVPRSKRVPVAAAGFKRRPGPMSSKMSLQAIKSEDTICIICSKPLPADPVSIVLQNWNRLSQSLSVFCNVMEMDKDMQESFDFSKEKFPFCRPCGFAVDEMEEISDEMAKLQERMDKVKAKCCVKILESCSKKEPASVSAFSPVPEVSGRNGSSSQFDDRNLGKKKVDEMRKSIVTRFRPKLTLQKVDDLNHFTGEGSKLNSIRFQTNSLRRIPATVAIETREPSSSSSITNIYEDEEIKKMLRQLIDCVSTTSLKSTEHVPGDIEDMTVALQDENYLTNSLNSALKATRDAWVNDYLAQIFATTYSNLALWGSESIDTVQVEYNDDVPIDRIPKDSQAPTEMMTIGHLNTPEASQPLSPKPILIPCNHCSREFKTQRRLRIHLFRFHGEGQLAVFKCSICEKTYVQKAVIRRHLERCHNLNPQVTSLHEHFTKEIATGENTSPCPGNLEAAGSALNTTQPSLLSKCETLQVNSAEPVNNNPKESSSLSSVLKPVVRLVRLNLDQVSRRHH